MSHDTSPANKPDTWGKSERLSIVQRLHRSFRGIRGRLSVRLWRTFWRISDEDWAELQEIGLSPRDLPSADGAVTRVVPVGTVPLSSLYAARDTLFNTFVHSVQVIEPISLPPAAYHEKRGQCSAYKLIKALETYVQPDTFRVIGLVNADIYIPGTNFVFGTGVRGSRTIIIGLQRLIPHDWPDTEKSAMLSRRVATLVVSQVSAGLGLGPCENDGCARAPANSLRDLDRKTAVLCPTCATRIAPWLNNGP